MICITIWADLFYNWCFSFNLSSTTSQTFETKQNKNDLFEQKKLYRKQCNHFAPGANVTKTDLKLNTNSETSLKKWFLTSYGEVRSIFYSPSCVLCLKKKVFSRYLKVYSAWPYWVVWHRLTQACVRSDLIGWSHPSLLECSWERLAIDRSFL